MDSKRTDLVVALPASAGAGHVDRSWLQRHGWKLSGGLAALTLGGLLWRRRQRRSRAAELEPVTTQWLADHEYEAGQRGDAE